MLADLNIWARRWGPSIALLSAIVAILSLFVALPFGSSERSKPSIVDAKTEARPRAEVSATEALLPYSIKSAAKHRIDLNPIGLMLDCRSLLDPIKFNALNLAERTEVKNICLSPLLPQTYVSHYDRKIAGKERELLVSTVAVLQRLHPEPVMDTDYSAICRRGDEASFRSLVYFSWVSVALKAFLLSASFGLGNEFVEALDRGGNPEESLPNLPIMDGMSTIAYLSKSYRVLSTYQFDRLMHRYTDDELLSWAIELVAQLPDGVRAKFRATVRYYLEYYREVIKPKSADLGGLYYSAMDSTDLVSVSAGRIVANFPRNQMYLSCPALHIERFWLRRLTNGTEKRLEVLAEKFLNRS